MSRVKLILAAGCLLLLSCGDGDDTHENDGVEGNEQTQENESINSNAISEEEDFTPEHANLDLTDYVEILLETEVKMNADDFDYNEGDQYYYDILDVKGGYAVVTGAMEGAFEFALWRMADGSALVGQTASSCGPVCDYSHHFYKFEGDEQEEVTKTILPWDEIDQHHNDMHNAITDAEELEYEEDSQLWFRLPQKGTSMEIFISAGANEIEVPLMKLSWDKEKFSVSDKYMDWGN